MAGLANGGMLQDKFTRFDTIHHRRMDNASWHKPCYVSCSKNDSIPFRKNWSPVSVSLFVFYQHLPNHVGLLARLQKNGCSYRQNFQK